MRLVTYFLPCVSSKSLFSILLQKPYYFCICSFFTSSLHSYCYPPINHLINSFSFTENFDICLSLFLHQSRHLHSIPVSKLLAIWPPTIFFTPLCPQLGLSPIWVSLPKSNKFKHSALATGSLTLFQVLNHSDCSYYYCSLPSPRFPFQKPLYFVLQTQVLFQNSLSYSKNLEVIHDTCFYINPQILPHQTYYCSINNLFFVA